MTDILTDLPGLLQELLVDLPDQLNTEYGVVRRYRQITPSRFVRTLVFGWLQDPKASLADLAEYATSLLDSPITEAGLRNHLTPAAVSLLTDLLDHALSHLIEGVALPSALLARFPGVFLFDSSIVSLPARLARFFPGTGNQNGVNAACKLLFGFELTRGGLLQLQLGSARQPDQDLAEALHPVPEGALTLCDLGFFSLERLDQQKQVGDRFLSRAQPQLVVQLQGGGTQPLLDFVQGLGDVVDMEDVEVGTKQRLRCRVIAWRVPDAVAQRRKRKCQEQHSRKQKRWRKRQERDRKAGRSGRRAGKRKGRPPATGPSAEQLAWCDWVVLLTNVPPEHMSVSEAEALLRARWQIELLIKLWKGFGGLERHRGRTKERVQCELLAKLLGQVVMHWTLLSGGRPYVQLCVERAAKQVRKYAERLGQSLEQGEDALRPLLAELARRIANCGRRQRRRQQPSTAQRLDGQRPPYFAEPPPHTTPPFGTETKPRAA